MHRLGQVHAKKQNFEVAFAQVELKPNFESVFGFGHVSGGMVERERKDWLPLLNRTGGTPENMTRAGVALCNFKRMH